MNLQENISLEPYNTFGINVNAKFMLAFSSEEEIRKILKSDVYLKNDHFILGGGSNVLFTTDVDGLVLKNEIHGREILQETDEYALVKFGAGEVWHECVLWAIENNLGGIENLSLIPGTMGAAPMQNIGAYGVEIKEVLRSVEAIEKATGEKRVFDDCDCTFGYRESIFKNELKDQFILTTVTLKLSKNHELKLGYGAIQQELAKRDIKNPTIKDVSDVVIAIRESKLPNPKEIGNAGSFFKNPIVNQATFNGLRIDYPDMPHYQQTDGIKIPAGWLLEKAGWKGFEEDTIGVHKKQALVLVNLGGGKGSEIFNLSERIIKDVQFRFGIELQREVNVL